MERHAAIREAVELINANKPTLNKRRLHLPHCKVLLVGSCVKPVLSQQVKVVHVPGSKCQALPPSP